MILNHSRQNIWFPVALALILPAFSLYTYSGLAFTGSLGIIRSWLIASTVMYLLWYFLWSMWEIRSVYKKCWFFPLCALFPGALAGIVHIVQQSATENLGRHIAVRTMFGSLLILVIQYTMRVQRKNTRLQLEKERIQTVTYREQLKTLRSQVDPHFLFNSLNTLRSMIHTNHANSEKFLISLSDFYRQTLKHNASATLPLSEELAVLDSYLFVMKSRYEDAFSIVFNIDESYYHYHVPSLSLQLVVENCFKHNSMTTRSPLQIYIESTSDFYVKVRNQLQPKFTENDQSGRGLEMLKERYELMNIENGVFYEATDGQFVVKLRLL